MALRGKQASKTAGGTNSERNGLLKRGTVPAESAPFGNFSSTASVGAEITRRRLMSPELIHLIRETSAIG